MSVKHTNHVWKVVSIDIVPIETTGAMVLFLPETTPQLKVKYVCACSVKRVNGECGSRNEGTITIDLNELISNHITHLMNPNLRAKLSK